MARFTAVDLSQLAAPNVIEEISYEVILTALKGDFVARLAAAGVDYDVQGLESDPGIKVLEVADYREVILRARVNSAARAVMLAYAHGTDLEHLAVYYGVSRNVVTPADGETPAVMEDDESLRRRVQLAPEAFTTAGSEGAYQFHTYGVDASIKDVAVLTPNQGDGQVHVLPLVKAGNGVPSSQLIERVRTRLFAKDVKPLTDIITVRVPVVTNFTVSATLMVADGPDKSVITANARAAALTYMATRHKIGIGVKRAGLIAALKVAGVEDLTLSPAANIDVPDDGVANCTALTVAAA